MDKAAKAKNVYERIQQKAKFSGSSMRWLQIITDPFKDLDIAKEGTPDQIMLPSVLQVVPMQFNVTSTNGTSTNWDCNIFMDCLTSSEQTVSSTLAFNSVFPASGQGGTTCQRGGVVTRQAASGTDLTADVSSTSNGLPSNYYNNSDTRIVACGFEVHDVTSELNKQGSVTVWRQGKDREEPVVTTMTYDGGATACIPTSIMSEFLLNPPVNVGQAIILPGSKTWEAPKGAYVVPCMAETTNMPDQLANGARITVDNVGTYYPSIAVNGAAKIMTGGNLNANSPFSMQGAFFQGLNPQAQLVVNVIYVVERFPSNNNLDLTTMARPSNAYDPRIIALYTEMCRSMPVGVPVVENGWGDWVFGAAKLAMQALKVANPIQGGLLAIDKALGSDKSNSVSNLTSNVLVPYKPNNNNSSNKGPMETVTDFAFEKGFEAAKFLANKVFSDNNNNSNARVFDSNRSNNNNNNPNVGSIVSPTVFIRPNKGKVTGKGYRTLSNEWTLQNSTGNQTQKWRRNYRKPNQNRAWNAFMKN